MAVTGSDITAAPRWARARTMSRSLAIPSTAVPSCETTTAPIRCSAKTARRRRTLVSGVTVTTWVPLTRRTSLIRIGPPRHQYAADRVPVPVPQAGEFNRGCRADDRWRLRAVTRLGLATRVAVGAARSMRGAALDHGARRLGITA